MAVEYDDIIDSIRVDEVLDSLGVDVTRIRNGNHWGDCPLHDDNGEHFSIDEDTLVWNCFHCGGGLLPQLVAQVMDFEDGVEGRAWDQAVEWLLPYSDGTVESLTDEQFLEKLKRNIAKGSVVTTRHRKVDLPVYSERVLNGLDDVPPEVLAHWNIAYQETAVRFKLGYQLARERGSYVGPALVIPHYFHGRLVGYQERWLGDDRPRWLKKYMNTDDFPRHDTLFNWDEAKLGGPVFVVESVMSVIRLWELGYDAVATFGAKVTDAQLRLLRTIESGIYLSFDNDKDGRAALARCNAHLMGEVPVWSLPFIDKDKGDICDLTDDEVEDLIGRRRAGILA